MADKNQAPNMYVDWNISGNSFDMILVDFYCDVQAIGTYWAVLNWNNGYAGFQNESSRHILMFSIWDNNQITPKIEYYIKGKADENNFDFSGEGTGKHICTNIQWSMWKWYGMAVGTKSFGSNTYYMQWLRDDSNEWKLIGIISFPVANLTLNKSSVFQEDFVNNKNKKRRCRVNNSYGRNSQNNNWISWNTGKIRSCYYPTTNSSGIWDDTINCGFGKGSDNGREYVYLEAGGDSMTQKRLPYNFYLNSQLSPVSYPEFPKCIKSKYSGLFVNHNGSQVVQSSQKYWWNFVDAGIGGGYINIKSTDNEKALTVTSMVDDGAELVLSDFIPREARQIWKIQKDVNGFVYIIPTSSPSRCMDIRGPSGDEGAIIQLWTYNTHAEQFKWYIL